MSLRPLALLSSLFSSVFSLKLAASPSGPTSSRLSGPHCEGASQGRTDGLIDTLGLSSSISLGCPSPHTHAPSAPQDGPTGGPFPSSPAPPGWGSWFCPAFLAPGLGFHPPQSPLVHLLLLDFPLRATG
ncbi:hypothetical protein MC885_011418 [Smutsia gigantea]|nr:hypothetical protein MC885_011418 [Smutsia gigantea]